MKRTLTKNSFHTFLIVFSMIAAAGTPLHAQFQPRNYVHLSPGIVQAHLLHLVPPLYPEQAKSNHIRGVVVLNAVIGKDGHIENLSISSGPKELCQAAIDAAKQWRYSPFIVKGRSVEVETRIYLTFSLPKDGSGSNAQ
jgi:protein TonB